MSDKAADRLNDVLGINKEKDNATVELKEEAHGVEPTIVKKKRVHIMTPKRVIAFQKAQAARKEKLEQRRLLKTQTSNDEKEDKAVKTSRKRRVGVTTLPQ
jgi:hypothetical protein